MGESEVPKEDELASIVRELNGFMGQLQKAEAAAQLADDVPLAADIKACKRSIDALVESFDSFGGLTSDFPKVRAKLIGRINTALSKTPKKTKGGLYRP